MSIETEDDYYPVFTKGGEALLRKLMNDFYEIKKEDISKTEITILETCREERTLKFRDLTGRNKITNLDVGKHIRLVGEIYQVEEIK